MHINRGVHLRGVTVWGGFSGGGVNLQGVEHWVYVRNIVLYIVVF